MKHNLVKIRPTEDNWEISFTYIHPLGFYYYPKHVGKETAFNILKDFLIENYSIEIESLLKKRESLKKLTILN
jgi:hypothetical protein